MTNIKHGKCFTPTYCSWNEMKRRCRDAHRHTHGRYGGRGIKVCRRWLYSFSNFLADMGERPPGTTLDRKDNNGNYTPENCRWATQREQHGNKCSNRRIRFCGRTMILADWARELGINPATLWWRLARYPVKVALTPRGKNSR